LASWRNNKRQQRANKLLETQKQQIQTALQELKATQAQLIQSEKMASLGELTAGIAHEIQNPLNFVNNFSEVSIELLAELKEEENQGNKEDVMAIAGDLTANLEKINHHGKRADAIVKGMLQHSRASAGQKELTDLNALAEEYLRLSYHGLRAKDKNFNADLITSFNPQLPRVNVLPQEIGRVILNVLNNAFYATQQKIKMAAPGYKPTIELNTNINGNLVQIAIKDNGIGIPATIKDKIMQPFFTTKPTGEGTGLGLSLSYDIVVKAHGGKIDVTTEPGEGAVFTISLPI
jgi:two-component system NtrC family sensor kinase